jgi:hypothetical protein
MSINLPPFGLAQVAHAARILAACALAFSVSWLLRLPEIYWSLVTVIIVTQPDLPSTVTASRDRIIGTLIGAAVGALAIIGREHGLSTLPLYAVGLVPLVNGRLAIAPPLLHHIHDRLSRPRWRVFLRAADVPRRGDRDWHVGCPRPLFRAFSRTFGLNASCNDVGCDFYDRAPPILKLGSLAMLEAIRRASSSVSKFADVRRPGSSS